MEDISGLSISVLGAQLSPNKQYCAEALYKRVLSVLVKARIGDVATTHAMSKMEELNAQMPIMGEAFAALGGKDTSILPLSKNPTDWKGFIDFAAAASEFGERCASWYVDREAVDACIGALHFSDVAKPSVVHANVQRQTYVTLMFQIMNDVSATRRVLGDDLGCLNGDAGCGIVSSCGQLEDRLCKFVDYDKHYKTTTVAFKCCKAFHDALALEWTSYVSDVVRLMNNKFSAMIPTPNYLEHGIYKPSVDHIDRLVDNEHHGRLADTGDMAERVSRQISTIENRLSKHKFTVDKSVHDNLTNISNGTRDICIIVFVHSKLRESGDASTRAKRAAAVRELKKTLTSQKLISAMPNGLNSMIEYWVLNGEIESYIYEGPGNDVVE